ncbi:MAG: DUF86 domain-containing protein [Deltaproteobacteria bacterium]|nr:DUF86 domain-containing protein [Deltaproteobacteria bacterium]MBW2354520.1 DUF86 domain-containing protein [Deltaproteobacteria bacterium]HDH97813.1 DUF86 domain-containing protein [Deltaproteobacteria bacterium]
MSERDPRLYCDDILESGSAILDFVEGLSFEDFCDDRKTYSAVIREFEIIGEAVSKLPESFRERRPDVEWQDIKDFRNLLSHEYFGVDLEIVWNIIEDDLSPLMDAVKEIVGTET